MRESFTGYILAGGKSSRMGADKAFLKIGEKTFLENAVEILKPNCEQIKIVLNKSRNHFIKKLPVGVSHIFDIHENRGALGGIHAAFENCQTEYAVILAVDLPFVTSEAVGKLCEIILCEKDFSAIVPRQRDKRLQPLCAVYRSKDCLNQLKEILSNNEPASVRDFLKKIETKIIEADILDKNQDLFLNVNNRSEYEIVEPGFMK
jgi:molybdopterin-guanine dinucleotide biosynthesis protein A